MVINSELVITTFAVLLAVATVAGTMLSFSNRTKKRERYRNMIQRKRKDIFEHNKEGAVKKVEAAESAKTTIEMTFRVRKIVGKLADDLRSSMLQAGYRNPSAPLVFVVLRLAVPLVFALLALMVMSSMDEKPEGSMALLVLMGVMGIGFVFPGIMLKNQIIKRQTEINLSFPDALDMMLVCVQGGISLEQAINRIAEEIADHSTMLAEELGFLGAELGLLNDRRAAFQDFARRVGSGGARSFATAMIQAEQYGTGISTALRVMADELRDIRMAEAERKAASLPPKLTVPMILFFLPALFIVILGPAAIQAMMAGQGG